MRTQPIDLNEMPNQHCVWLRAASKPLQVPGNCKRVHPAGYADQVSAKALERAAFLKCAGK